MYFPLFKGVLCLSLFCYALLCFLSSFAIILKRKRKLVALLLLSYRCIVTISVLLLFLVVFPDQTHLIFGTIFSVRKLSQCKTLVLISKVASVGSDEPAFHCSLSPLC